MLEFAKPQLRATGDRVSPGEPPIHTWCGLTLPWQQSLRWWSTTQLIAEPTGTSIDTHGSVSPPSAVWHILFVTSSMQLYAICGAMVLLIVATRLVKRWDERAAAADEPVAVAEAEEEDDD